MKVAALHGARVVAGSLTISTTDPVTLPLLELVSGDLLTGTPTDPRGPAARELPALRRVGGFLGVGTGSSAPGSSAPDLPVLTEVDGNMFAGTGSVALDLPALQQIGGNLSLGPGTATVTLDSLDKVGGELAETGKAGERVVAHQKEFARDLGYPLEPVE